MKSTITRFIGATAVAGLALAIAWPGHGNNTASLDWPSVGDGSAEQRFSNLAEITPATVSRLGVAWYHEFDTDRGQEATPIEAGGILYTSTAWSKVYAFDARTGVQLWSFDPKVPHARFGFSCCDAVNRGVALADGKIFVGAFDGRLIALDAKTGKQLWSVQTFDPAQPYTITGAPRVVKGKVIIGSGGAEYGVRGYITAYDAATGKKAWRFYTVPNPTGTPDGEASDAVLKAKVNATWFDGGWKKTGGGGTAWDGMAYDPEADLFYFGVGNGSPHNYQIRSGGKGDNLFLSSIVALRPETGEYVWHYQVNPGESWDYTATQPIMLADLTIDGKPRKVLMQAPKDGFFYVLDRLTGKPISADPFTEVTWATGIDLATGRPIEKPGIHLDKGPVDMMPGPLGGHSVHPWSYSPVSGLVYIPAQHLGHHYAPGPWTFHPGHYNNGYDFSQLFDVTPAGLAEARKSVYGELVAWDPIARKARWTVRHPYFLNGGTLATRGGVVFQGTSEGSFDAYGADDGRKLWTFDAGNSILGGPISYALGGKQYVAVMVGFGGGSSMVGALLPKQDRLPGRLLVFALDGTTTVPAQTPPPRRAPLNLAGVTTSGDIEKGRVQFATNCLACHGSAAASRFQADLHRSPFITNAQSLRSVVLGGALKARGMTDFAGVLTANDVEDIRAYMIAQAKADDGK